MSNPQAFHLGTAQPVLDRIAMQLQDYQWPPVPHGAGWSMGMEDETLRRLAACWRESFDWREEEARLNREPHFKAVADGVGLHFVHWRAADAKGRPPLVLMHGWPSSFLEYLECGAALAGGDDARDVVAVSLPGFGYSDIPSTAMGPRAIARVVHALMTEVLGYDRYVAHGADWGAIIAGWMGFDHSRECAGIHMTMVSPRFVAGAASEPAEQQWLAGFRDKFEDDGAYFRLQTTRPATLGYALADNPIGLLAWLGEKLVAWSDLSGTDATATCRIPECSHRLIRTTMLYLVTGTAASSTWIYRGLAAEGPPGYPGGARVEVPVAIAAMRDPVFASPPRSLVSKAYRVVRWTDYDRGGHFPGYEVPALLTADLRAFSNAL